MMVVVAYDVNTESPEGKRRLRNVAKTCMKYGQRVQNSVFECSVSPSDYLILKHDLAEIMDESQDSLRYYNLGAKYSSKIEHRGRQRHLPIDDALMSVRVTVFHDDWAMQNLTVMKTKADKTR